MKALSVRQPWAWLIVNGFKDIENRGQRTHFRGRVYIHTGITMTKPEYDECSQYVKWVNECRGSKIELPAFHALERGGVVGAVDIIGCVDESESLWFGGPFGYELANAEAMPIRVCKGALGFFEPVFEEEGGLLL